MSSSLKVGAPLGFSAVSACSPTRLCIDSIQSSRPVESKQQQPLCKGPRVLRGTYCTCHLKKCLVRCHTWIWPRLVLFVYVKHEVVCKGSGLGYDSLVQSREMAQLAPQVFMLKYSLGRHCFIKVVLPAPVSTTTTRLSAPSQPRGRRRRRKKKGEGRGVDQTGDMHAFVDSLTSHLTGDPPNGFVLFDLLNLAMAPDPRVCR